jgi:hypothetical protein
MEVLLIEDESLFGQVKAFLYKCYIQEFGWQVPSDNPSRIVFKESTEGLSLLTDDYDKHALWFAAVQANCIVACARLCTVDSNNLLELERYPEAREKLHLLLKEKEQLNIIELNREAISLKESKYEKPCLFLLEKIFTYCLQKGFSILTTTNMVNWLNIYDKISFPKLEGFSFKYHVEDKDEVVVYFAQKEDLIKMRNRIIECLNNMENYYD